MKNIMIDIETLGTEPGSVITSVGAVEFDVDRGLGREIEVYFDVDNSLEFDFKVSGSTLRFWSEQPRTLYQRQIAEAPPASLGLNRLRTFFQDVRADDARKLRIWANAPTFDLVLLREYFKRYRLPVPWHFTEEFDLRTLGNLMKMPRHADDPGGVKDEEDHDALSDARSQARATIIMLKQLWKMKGTQQAQEDA